MADQLGRRFKGGRESGHDFVFGVEPKSPEEVPLAVVHGPPQEAPASVVHRQPPVDAEGQRRNSQAQRSM